MERNKSIETVSSLQKIRKTRSVAKIAAVAAIGAASLATLNKNKTKDPDAPFRVKGEQSVSDETENPSPVVAAEALDTQIRYTMKDEASSDSVSDTPQKIEARPTTDTVRASIQQTYDSALHTDTSPRKETIVPPKMETLDLPIDSVELKMAFSALIKEALKKGEGYTTLSNLEIRTDGQHRLAFEAKLRAYLVTTIGVSGFIVQKNDTLAIENPVVETKNEKNKAKAEQSILPLLNNICTKLGQRVAEANGGQKLVGMSVDGSRIILKLEGKKN